MKPIKTFAIFLLLLAMLLPGCSADALMEQGVDLLDQLFAGDSSESRLKVEQQPDKTSPSEPETPSDAQEPEGTDYPDAVEPSIPAESNEPAEPSEPTSQEPAAQEPSSAAPAGNITASHTDATFFGPGESFKYLPKGVSGVYACTYATEDEDVASVDQATGKVTAVGPGTTKVTMHVECNGQYDFECIIRCKWEDEGKEPKLSAESSEPKLPASTDQPANKPVDSAGGITASHTDATFFGPGESFKYLPKGVSGVYACTYATEDEDVASVDQATGKVTAVGPGTTKVTMHVECNGQYDFECIVRCNWE